MLPPTALGNQSNLGPIPGSARPIPGQLPPWDNAPLQRPALFEQLFAVKPSTLPPPPVMTPAIPLQPALSTPVPAVGSPAPTILPGMVLGPNTPTPDEIRVSQAALRQAPIDQAVINAPWNSHNIFTPYPKIIRALSMLNSGWGQCRKLRKKEYNP